MKGYKLTGRGKITALCLVLMAVILLVSAFTHLGKASSPPTAHETPTTSLSHAELPSSAPTLASVQAETSPVTPTATPSPPPTHTPAPAASPSPKPTVKSTPAPATPPLPAGKTSLYFTPGTLELLTPDLSLHDYLIDSYEGLTLMVEGFASDRESAESTEQLALDRSQAVSQILKDLGVQSYDLMSIGTYRTVQDDTEAAEFARADVYFLSTGSK